MESDEEELDYSEIKKRIEAIENRIKLMEERNKAIENRIKLLKEEFGIVTQEK